MLFYHNTSRSPLSAAAHFKTERKLRTPEWREGTQTLVWFQTILAPFRAVYAQRSFAFHPLLGVLNGAALVAVARHETRFALAQVNALDFDAVPALRHHDTVLPPVLRLTLIQD